MTHIRSLVSLAMLASVALSSPTWAAAGDQHDSHHPTSDTVTQVAQAQTGSQDAGMRARTTTPDYANQMKAMRQMHDEMMAAKTPEERSALMTKQMKLMQSGMKMMGGMGGEGMMNGMGGKGMMGSGMGTGAAPDKSMDMATRQAMMEQRMGMMQSMMQMMMDRMQAMPTTE